MPTYYGIPTPPRLEDKARLRAKRTGLNEDSYTILALMAAGALVAAFPSVPTNPEPVNNPRPSSAWIL